MNVQRIASLLRLLLPVLSSSQKQVKSRVKDVCDTTSRTISQFILLNVQMEEESAVLRQNLMRDFVSLLQDITIVRRVISNNSKRDEEVIVSMFESTSGLALGTVYSSNKSHFDIVIPSASVAMHLQYTVMSVLHNVISSNQLWLTARQTLFRPISSVDPISLGEQKEKIILGESNSSEATLNTLVRVVRAIFLWNNGKVLSREGSFIDQGLFDAACDLFQSLLPLVESECCSESFMPMFLLAVTDILQQYFTCSGEESI